MRKYQILLAGALAAAAGSAYAAMGPTQFGLPINWTMTPTVGYGAATGVAGNGASAMCVECHTVSPSDRILDVSNRAAGDVRRDNANTLASHFVMNVGSGIGATNSGGGFLSGFGGIQDNGKYLRGGAWSAGPTYLSKFSNGATLTSAYEGVVSAANAGMICESCHNIINNVVGANDQGAADNDLLLGVYEDNRQDAICRGCHLNDEAAANSVFHTTNSNLPSFSNPPARKRHHVLTNDTILAANYGLTGVSSLMWAPSFSDKLATEWCTQKYLSGINPAPLADGATATYRGLCNVAGSGTRVLATVAAQGDISPANVNDLNCTNCHRPHNAGTFSGAFILRPGKVVDSTDQTLIAYPAGNTSATHPVGTPKLFQVRRQSDVGDYAGNKIYQEYRILCAGCHYGY